MSSPGLVHQCLAKATSRAKSDVANKLVSMFLHDISRRIIADLEYGVSNPRYAEVVYRFFGDDCAYCALPLEKGNLAVEHLEGMNRIRVGLHVPGNVALACRDCNREKRRDDQVLHGALAPTGWESFMAHNGTRCEAGCKTCVYWAAKYPGSIERHQRLIQSTNRISTFRKEFSTVEARVALVHSKIRKDIKELYRECQDFATVRIAAMVRDVEEDLKKAEG